MSKRKLIPTITEKLCKRCGTTKSVNEFGRSGSRKDFCQDWCKECVKKRAKDRYAVDGGWVRVQAWNSERRLKHYDLITAYLREHPCVDCSEADPVVLEFDHRDPEKKQSDISKMAGRCSWKKIEKEIRKCDVVCSNCHRKRTAKQFGWRRWMQGVELEAQTATETASTEPTT